VSGVHEEGSGDPPAWATTSLPWRTTTRRCGFENQIYVEWPCYFHADWYELAPLLLGQNPGDGKYNASDFQLSAYPGGLNRQYLQGLKDGVAEWARTELHGVDQFLFCSFFSFFIVFFCVHFFFFFYLLIYVAALAYGRQVFRDHASLRNRVREEAFAAQLSRSARSYRQTAPASCTSD